MLRPLPGTKCPRGRNVDQEQDRQLPLLAEPLDKRAAAAGGHVPIDIADVVARLILPHFVEFHAAAAKHALVLPREQIVHRPVGNNLNPPHTFEDVGNVLHEKVEAKGEGL
jgi:hypothetical protein